MSLLNVNNIWFLICNTTIWKSLHKQLTGNQANEPRLMFLFWETSGPVGPVQTSVDESTMCSENKQWLTHTHLLLSCVAGLTGSECCFTANFSSGKVGKFKKMKTMHFSSAASLWDPVSCIAHDRNSFSRYAPCIVWNGQNFVAMFVYKCFHFCTAEAQLSEAVGEYSNPSESNEGGARLLDYDLRVKMQDYDWN